MPPRRFRTHPEETEAKGFEHRAEGVAPLLEYLPRVCKALGPTPGTTEKKKKCNRKKKKVGS